MQYLSPSIVHLFKNHLNLVDGKMKDLHDEKWLQVSGCLWWDSHCALWALSLDVLAAINHVIADFAEAPSQGCLFRKFWD
jgi:hypothetical protein